MKTLNETIVSVLSEVQRSQRDNRFNEYKKWKARVNTLGYRAESAKNIYKCYDNDGNETGHFDYLTKSGIIKW